jgi:paraquat-inducible protein B
MTETNSKKRRKISPMWVVPVFAAFVVVWLVLKARSERGPEIIVYFEQADGLEQGKTPVNFRGVKVGVVSRLEILPDYLSVAAHIRLEKFAKDLARDGSSFYINRPVMSLAQGITGLDTLISGNYIIAEAGSGPEKFEFQGLRKVPPVIAPKYSFPIRLRARKVPSMTNVEPVYYRGVKIGMVIRHEVDPDGDGIIVYAEINPEFNHLIRTDARFWPLSLVGISLGAGTVDLNVKNPETLMRGGIEMDFFGEKGKPAEENAMFEMSPTQDMARCTGSSFEVFFENGQGITPEKTIVRYRGYPVGMVQSVQPEPAQNRVRVKARLFDGYDGLLKEQSAFWLVRPTVNLQGVQGVETIFSGEYLECRPGPGKARSTFVGMESQPYNSVEGPGTSHFVLRAERSILPVHSPIYYRGVEVGRVVGKELSADARSAYLEVEIAAAYRPLVRQNTKFYNVSGIDAYFGFLGIKVRADSLESIAAGGLAFATPDGAQMGGPAKEGQVFDLYDKADPLWLKWAPAIPLAGQ